MQKAEDIYQKAIRNKSKEKLIKKVLRKGEVR